MWSMLHTHTSRKGAGVSESMLGAVPGTLIVIASIVLGVVLLAYAVYFFFFKKM